jgi:hypothetical protein
MHHLRVARQQEDYQRDADAGADVADQAVERRALGAEMPRVRLTTMPNAVALIWRFSDLTNRDPPAATTPKPTAAGMMKWRRSFGIFMFVILAARC